MTKKTVEESIADALELPDIALIKYLPYIFQDFWELGSSSEEFIKIIWKHKEGYSSLNVLDLGSGKGAVSIKIASELGCRCFGIDAVEDFVNHSINKAKEYAVSDKCDFETNDVRVRVKSLGRYDIIILGAIGRVFGDYFDTLTTLQSHLKEGGLIIIDDAYIEDDCEKEYGNIYKKGDVIRQIHEAGMELVEIVRVDGNDSTTPYPSNLDGNFCNDTYEGEYQNIQKRCMELAEKHPEDRELFIKYIDDQKEEYRILSEEIVPVIFVVAISDCLIVRENTF